MEKTSITYAQAKELLLTLRSLEPDTESAISPFNFPGRARVAFAINMRKLKDAMGVIDELQGKLIKELDLKVTNSGNGRAEIRSEDTDEGRAKMSQFFTSLSELMASNTDIELRKISINDLNLDKNQIKSEVLATLMVTMLKSEGEDYEETSAPEIAVMPKKR